MNQELEFQTIMEQHTDGLFRIAYYYTKNIQVAEDIVQDTFVKFYFSNYYNEQGELKAYLSRITVNLCKDYLKSWAHKKMVFQEKWYPSRAISEKDKLIELDEMDLLDEAILSLPLKQREAIVYFYLENMLIKDIAALLGISENTVKSRLRRGKELLRQRLSDIEWEVLLNA